MAPSLPSCISSTFCSHRQASWFVLATLSPFFLPFLILCVPFLLLFLAPVSVFLFSLLLFYKVQVSLRPKLKLFHRRADKGVEKGYRPSQQIAAAEKLDIHQQALLEEIKGSEGSNVQSVEWRSQDKEGDEVDSCTLPSRVCEVEQEKLGHSEEDLAEDKTEKTQEEQNIIGGPSAEEDREGSRQGHSPEYEASEVSNVQNVEEQDITGGPSVEEGTEGSRQGRFQEYEAPEVSDVQNVELLASSKGRAEEGLQRPEGERENTEGTQKDMGKERPQKDRTEDNKQEEVEVEVTQESIDLKDEQKQPPLFVDATSSHTSEEYRRLTDEGTQEDIGKELLPKDREENKQEEVEVTQESIDVKDEQKQTPLFVERTSEEFRPLTDEGERLDRSYSRDNQSSVPADQQGQESIEDRSERLESSHAHQFEEAWGKVPAIQVSEPHFQTEPAVFPDQVVDKPSEGIGTPVTHEHIREEPELSSEKDSSLEIVDNKGRLDKQEDIIPPTESFKKETEKGEPSYSLSEGHGQLRREPFVEETTGDEQPQTDRSAKDLATSFEAELSPKTEEGHPVEATSSTTPLPHESHEGPEVQDRTLDEQKIMADINAIKKIIGYQADPHASILEQISALYVFLGMEPYNWAAEVDNLERAEAEIELLKVVVGVK